MTVMPRDIARRQHRPHPRHPPGIRQPYAYDLGMGRGTVKQFAKEHAGHA